MEATDRSDEALALRGELTSAWRRSHACSGLTSRLILAYVEREGGGRAVERLLASAGLSEDEERLRDENEWFSYETKLALFDAAAELLGDASVAEHAGAAVLDLSVGMGLKRTLRALGTPGFVYGSVVRANAKFNWAHTLEVLDKGPARVRLRYTDACGAGYHRYDCDYTKGLLAVVPQLFGLPLARVAHPVCGARGGSCCEFDVRWTTGTHAFTRGALALAAGAAALAGAGVLADPVLVPAAGAAFVLGEATIAARAFAFMRERLRVLEGRVREQEAAAESLLSSLQDLSSDPRVDEVLHQITARAQSAVGGKEFALLLADGETMRAHRHSGIPRDSLAALERWAEADRAMLRQRGTVVVDDLAAEPALSELPRQARMPLGSLCAAPLVFRDRLLGVLVALAHGTTVFLPGDTAALSAYAGHAAIALSNARLVDTLERRAAEDPLTGLANQRAFYDASTAEFSRALRGGSRLSIAMLDIDHFKSINDEHGHLYGDQVLIGVADALRSCMRAHDTVARMGGEEFAILLPDTGAELALEIAERARAAIGEVPIAGGSLSCSAGVATASPDGAVPVDLLALADHALYEAKRRGRDRTVVSDPAASRSHAA
jgi:diguanylate cyclase (GGDEF)-like protein